MHPLLVVNLLANAYRGNSEIEQEHATQGLAHAVPLRGGVQTNISLSRPVKWTQHSELKILVV
jgi:hypothetical protein